MVKTVGLKHSRTATATTIGTQWLRLRFAVRTVILPSTVSCYDVDEKGALYNHLHHALSNIPMINKVYLLSDFNTRAGQDLEP